MIQRNDSSRSPALSRRTLLRASTLAPLAAGLAGPALAAAGKTLPGSLAREGDFAPLAQTYLDSGTMHPVPLGAKASLDTYMTARSEGRSWSSHDTEVRIKGAFARLINAAPEDLAFVQSTTAGEQLVIEALDLPAAGGSVVTDTLHFFGSFWLYQQLGEQGVDVRWVRPVEGRIDPEAYEKAIGPDTRLVSVSLVSTYNGFEHDLARICEIAHAHGAMVYADIIHAAGTVPIDVRASGVDFAASASYKWLMGDFGLGFLYVRPDRLAALKRPRYGYYQLAKFAPHVYPYDAPGETIADMAPREDAQGMFAMGTHSHAVMAMLDWSLPRLLELGIDNIVAHRMPMLERLHAALPAKGYSVATPRDCRSPLFTCVLPDAYKRLSEPLDKAGVKITLSRNRFRVCPSWFNTMDDIERLIDALPAQDPA
ncbi:aminotransferase class V-fold PLP-dependent enzyme [Novosphingobium sp. YJ-S2-02]|uniref:Aminotransferase class V-fold PLP-dependent enzyme n=1 Tax=Novosphingobium aureum TaxID=2792964 RepID=A0A931HEV2_9SPHN|nr:aminotransferase class V-fold PLP-dependent enzyme [Novosphingobium aureum]MBH0114527.1 aminotransferase class V-fold PLP-dependent enzyme [Novosphingobium aureum]